ARRMPLCTRWPKLPAMSPPSASAPAGGFTLTMIRRVTGSGASVSTKVTRRTTTLVSPTQVTAAIPASDIAAVGTAQVTVTMPGVLGGTSGAQTFTITSPAPSLTSLSPSSASVGGAAFTLTLHGSYFVSGSTV